MRPLEVAGMPIKAMPCVSIRCDGCGSGHDEMYSTPAAEMENLKLYGWTGTYRKCFCPVCSKARKEDEDDG